jgi:tetratricopeptide (TPR) repeat protein
MKKNFRLDAALSLLILLGFIAVVCLSRSMDARHQAAAASSEEQLYLKGATAKRLSLAFNGLAADWYWMRSLQYVGGKVVKYEDTHPEQAQLDDLGALDLRLLPPLLNVATTLDPQFMAPYEYAAMILPTFSRSEAISLLHYGIEQNPSAWRLYQHLGYIYWQSHDYSKASETYGAGAKLPGAPRWMAEMSARTAAEGGSRQAAREMYQHLYEESNDDKVKELLERRLMQVDSFDERDRIRRALGNYVAGSGRCPGSWREVAAQLQALRLHLDPVTAAPLDPSGTPYVLTKNGCDVDLDLHSRVPYR